MDKDKKFNDLVSDIYSSYMNAKGNFSSMLDKDNRNPNILIDLATELGISPNKKDVIKITGSKGKGTTSRIIYNIIQHTTNMSVGLITSPEEIDHNDRISVNNEFISKDDFTRIYNILKPYFGEIENKFTKNNDYLSPSGIFLLIGLYYFKERGVECFIIETGRGCEFDEAGIIEANTSSITSIFLEHPEYLGNIEEITKNKSHCIKNSNHCVINNDTLEKLVKYNIQHENCTVFNSDAKLEINLEKQLANYPDWYKTNFLNSAQTVSLFLNKKVDALTQELENWKPSVVASFGYKNQNNKNIFYEPCISTKSIDGNMLKNLNNTLFISSFPDEKDIKSITEELSYYGDVKHIVLTGTRGYLAYNKTDELYKSDILFECEYFDEDKFSNECQKIFNNTNYENIYFIGTHTYIRLVKKAIFNFKI